MSISVCLSVCPSVREHISGTTVRSLYRLRRPSPACIAMSMSACVSIGLPVCLSASISPKLQSSLYHLRVTFHLLCRVRVADRLHLVLR